MSPASPAGVPGSPKQPEYNPKSKRRQGLARRAAAAVKEAGAAKIISGAISIFLLLSVFSVSQGSDCIICHVQTRTEMSIHMHLCLPGTCPLQHQQCMRHLCSVVWIKRVIVILVASTAKNVHPFFRRLLVPTAAWSAQKRCPYTCAPASCCQSRRRKSQPSRYAALPVHVSDVIDLKHVALSGCGECRAKLSSE